MATKTNNEWIEVVWIDEKRRFKCIHNPDICEEIFIRRDNAQIHQKIHDRTKECPFKGTIYQCWKQIDHYVCSASHAKGVTFDLQNRRHNGAICEKILANNKRSQSYNKHMKAVHNVKIALLSDDELAAVVLKLRRDWQ